MRVSVLHPAIGERSVELEADRPLVLGRSGPGVGLPLDFDETVSRSHARLWVADGKVWFEDLGSRNGSWLGAERIAGKVELARGVHVLVGQSVVSVTDAPSGWHAPPPGVVPPPDFAGRAVEAELESPTLTTDLPASSAEATRERPSLRRHHRVAHEMRIKVLAPGGSKERVTHDVSAGGLFFVDERPPPAGTPIEVDLGGMKLSAKVIHAVPAGTADRRPPGAGVEFTGVSGEARTALDRLLAQVLPEDKSLDTRAQAVSRRLAARDVVGALELLPRATLAEFRSRLRGLSADLDGAAQTELRAVLRRIDALVEGPTHGRLPGGVEGRPEAEPAGPMALQSLLLAWNRVYPERAERAAGIVRRAFIARHERRLEEAIGLAREALDLNPFQENLREIVDGWERELEAPRG